jgi:hypothetical protein
MVYIAVIFVFHYFCITHYSHIPILLKVALNSTTLTHHAHDNGYVSFFSIGLGPSNYLNSATFYWRACTKPGKWAYMYFVYRFCPFLRLWYFNVPTMWYFWVFHFITLRYSPQSRLITLFVRVNRHVPRVEQELLTCPEHSR